MSDSDQKLFRTTISLSSKALYKEAQGRQHELALRNFSHYVEKLVIEDLRRAKDGSTRSEVENLAEMIRKEVDKQWEATKTRDLQFWEQHKYLYVILGYDNTPRLGQQDGKLSPQEVADLLNHGGDASKEIRDYIIKEGVEPNENGKFEAEQIVKFRENHEANSLI